MTGVMDTITTTVPTRQKPYSQPARNTLTPTRPENPMQMNLL
jgi:hypothetical protein